MLEYPLYPTPLQNPDRLYPTLNPAKSVNYTAFIPPSISGEQYVIEDGQIGVAVQSVEILDAIANGSIAVLGSGRLVVI